MLSIVRELDRLGWRCKSWTTRDGRQRGGQSFDKSRLREFLTNPLFVGKIRHKGTIYDGLHDAIAPQALFDHVQKQLATNARRLGEFRNKHDAPLRGLLFCASCDCAVVHTFSGRGASGRKMRSRAGSTSGDARGGRESCNGRWAITGGNAPPAVAMRGTRPMRPFAMAACVSTYVRNSSCSDCRFSLRDACIAQLALNRALSIDRAQINGIITIADAVRVSCTKLKCLFMRRRLSRLRSTTGNRLDRALDVKAGLVGRKALCKSVHAG